MASQEHQAGWAIAPPAGSLSVNGELIRDLRKLRGWTQEQLADLAGYTPRLIRKAEAGGPVHVDTIEVLAATLSSVAAPVSPETLTTDLQAIARRFAISYAHDERQIASRSSAIFAPNVVYNMAGDPEQIPFAGRYHGLDGIDRWATAFFDTFSRPLKDLYRPQLYQAGTAVLAVGHDAVNVPGDSQIHYSVTVVRFEFERGKIVLADNDYDTHGTMEVLRQVRAKRQPSSNGQNGANGQNGIAASGAS